MANQTYIYKGRVIAGVQICTDDFGNAVCLSPTELPGGFDELLAWTAQMEIFCANQH